MLAIYICQDLFRGLTARASVAGWPGATLAEGQETDRQQARHARGVTGQPTAACAC